MPLTVTHAKSNTIADFTGTVTVHNSSGGTQTIAASNLVLPSDWNSAHATSLAVAANELFTVQQFEPQKAQVTDSTMSSQGVGTWYLDPFYLPTMLGSGQLYFMKSDAAGFLNGSTFSAASSGSITRTQTMNSQFAIYKFGTGANTSRLESVWSQEISMKATWERRVGTTVSSQLTVSNYLTLSLPAQYDISGGVTYSTTSQSGTVSTAASTGASSMADSLITGVVSYMSAQMCVPIPFATTLPQGHYVLARMYSSTSSSSGTNYSTGTMFSTQSVVGIAGQNDRGFRRIGKSVSDSSSCIPNWQGSYASTSSTPPANIMTSDLRNIGTPAKLYWYYAQSSF